MLVRDKDGMISELVSKDLAVREGIVEITEEGTRDDILYSI